jgi:hypothetical protein
MGERTPEAAVRVFDGAVLTVRIPMTFRRRGGRKLILAPDGVDGLAAEPPRPDGTALRALARAWRWHRLLEAGRYPSIKALARAEGVHHAYVAKLLRSTLLAPDMIEAVLDGRLPKGLKLEELVRPLPADWAEQRRVLVEDIARTEAAPGCPADRGPRRRPPASSCNRPAAALSRSARRAQPTRGS